MAQQKQVRQHEPLRVPDRWTGQDRTLVIQIERLMDEIYAKLGEIDLREKELKEATDALETATDNLETATGNLETATGNLETATENRVVGKRISKSIPGGTNTCRIDMASGHYWLLILSMPGINRVWAGLVQCASDSVTHVQQINSSTGMTVTGETNNYITCTFSYSTDANFNMVAIPIRSNTLPTFH